MLPFEKETTRKHQCFICGLTYNDYNDYKSHIVEKHEEGREYVLCPLVRCKAPVRDVRAHFAAKHKEEKCPVHGQMKALIWKDVSPNGKSKTRKPQFRNGTMTSIKNGGREMPYRSGLENEIYECLEAIPDVVQYHVEPFKGGIPYLFKGKQHHYFPDLSIQFTDSHIEIWEIKPSNQTDLAVNEAKWKAATTYCSARGWEFIVITEVGLSRLRKLAKNAQLLNE